MINARFADAIGMEHAIKSHFTINTQAKITIDYFRTKQYTGEA